MIAQTLSFQLPGLTEEHALKHCDMYAFALPEIDGLISQRWVRGMSSQGFIAMLVWDSPVALCAFRGSELYARFALDPHVSRLNDEDGQVLDDYTARPRNGRRLRLAAA